MIPRSVGAIGTWHTNGIELTDTLNHTGFESTVPAGSPDSFIVTGDVTAPVIQSWTVTPATVEVSVAPGIFTMDIRITDDVGIHAGFLTWQSPDSLQSQSASYDAANRLTGTAQDGVYRVAVTIPQGSPAGIWRLTNLTAADGFTTTTLSEEQFPPGNPTTLLVTHIPAMPEIAVEQPAGTDLADGAATVAFDPMLTGSPGAVITFTIRNPGTATLSGLVITMDGPQAGEFAPGTPGTLTLAPGASTTFTLGFTPVGGSGLRSATLHLASNDADESPFDIALTGQALSFASDGDGDGLNDASEFNMAALGFDWRVSQPALVSTYNANANGAGFYSLPQIQALHADVPLLTRDPATGKFKLTLSVQKSGDLSRFAPFPLTTPGASINGQGELEFEFTSPDNAAFFRLEAK